MKFKPTQSTALVAQFARIRKSVRKSDSRSAHESRSMASRCAKIGAACLLMFTIALPGCTGGGTASDKDNAGGSAGAKDQITIGLLPKRKGISFFTSCAEGAQAAADDLGNVKLVYDGPTDGDPAKAAELVRQWTLQGFDAIAVSADDAKILGAAMEKAQDKGVKVIAYDADVPPEARTFFVNQATPQQIGEAMVDVLAKEIGERGEVAIVSSSQTSANQNQWIEFMKQRLEKYPEMKLVAIEYPGEDQDRCLETTRTLLKAHPKLKGIWGISTMAFPGAAEAIRQAGKSGEVKVTGLSTPNPMKPYVADGTVESVILWDTHKLGYLTVQTAEALVNGRLKPGDTSLEAGKLGKRDVVGDNVMLGDILVFTKENINDYDF